VNPSKLVQEGWQDLFGDLMSGTDEYGPFELTNVFRRLDVFGNIDCV